MHVETPVTWILSKTIPKHLASYVRNDLRWNIPLHKTKSKQHEKNVAVPQKERIM